MSPIYFFNNPFTIYEKRTHCGVTVTKEVLINTTKNQNQTNSCNIGTDVAIHKAKPTVGSLMQGLAHARLVD